MIKGYLSLLLLIVIDISQAQTIVDSSSISKWVHATINIQCAPSTRPGFEELIDLRFAGKISIKQFKMKLDSLYLVRRSSGTAVFFLHNQRYHLLTARHVILDTSASNKNPTLSRIFLVESPQTMNTRKGISIDQNANVYITNDSDVTFINEISELDYELSSPKQDLGIIYLEENPTGEKKFLHALIKKGYVPITLSDIDTSCNIGREENIFAIGYPRESEIADKRHLQWQVLAWEGWTITAPMITFGTVESVPKNQDYFYGSIFVYHGFSGGPVIAKNKLIGITRGGVPEVKNTCTISPNIYLEHHSVLKKSSLIMPLLRKLESKFKR